MADLLLRKFNLFQSHLSVVPYFKALIASGPNQSALVPLLLSSLYVKDKIQHQEKKAVETISYRKSAKLTKLLFPTFKNTLLCACIYFFLSFLFYYSIFSPYPTFRSWSVSYVPSVYNFVHLPHLGLAIWALLGKCQSGQFCYLCRLQTSVFLSHFSHLPHSHGKWAFSLCFGSGMILQAAALILVGNRCLNDTKRTLLVQSKGL